MVQTETVKVDALPAANASAAQAERDEMDAIVLSLKSLKVGEAITIRENGATPKGLSQRLGRAASRVGMLDTTTRGSGTDERGAFGFIYRNA